MITLPTLKSLKAQFNNAQFVAASPEGKRVKIARDVLALMDAQALDVSKGRYLEFIHEDENEGREQFAEGAMCDLLQHDGAECRCCAIGSMMLAFACEAGPIERTSAKNRDEMAGYLQEFFSFDQLRLIEAAFECWDEEEFGDEGDDDADLFGRGYPDATNRLRGIMGNIITHNGTFTPEAI